MALIVPVAAPAILSLLSLLSLALIVPLCLWLRPLYCLSLCVFIDLLRSPSLRRDGVDMALIVPVAAPCGCARYIVFIVFGRPLSLCVFYVCLLTY